MDTDKKGRMDQPNILLINVDDLGWTDLGFMGSTFYETPAIDQLQS
jgi:arylsulfatase A-like enzyme